MASRALSQLLLAMMLPLLKLESTFVPTVQSELKLSGGKPGQELNQNKKVEESVLVSSYVQLEFSNRTRPQKLPENLTLPAASTPLTPRTLTALGLTTECHVNPNGTRFCTCHSGYLWNATLCSLYPTCHGHTSETDSCMCRSFHGPVPGYCQLLPPAPADLILDSQLQMPRDTLNLILLKKEEATNLRWYLKHPESDKLTFLRPGTNVSQMSSQGQTGLSITGLSRHWTGSYVSIFEAQGFRWRLSQVVQVPLEEKEVVRLPDELSISRASSSGFQLSCCIPLTNLTYTATWSPGEGSQASLHNFSDSQCLVLTVEHCPEADTTYTCTLHSQNLAPLVAPVSVTIIQDGDTTCPEDFSVVAWNVTKAGFVAQAPCPVNKRGMVKRLCGPDGTWGPVQNSCTEAEILATSIRAKLLLEGQGKPDEEVQCILSRLPGQVDVVSTPSDLQETLHTVTLLANVVAETRTELTDSALKDLLTTTDKILEVKLSSLWTLAQAQAPALASDFLKAVETLVHSLSSQQHPFSFTSSNVLLQSQLLRHTSPPGHQMSFPAWPFLQALIPWYSLAPLVHNGTNVSITTLVLQKLDHYLTSSYAQGMWTPYTTPGLVLVVSITADGQAFTQAELIMDFEDVNVTVLCVFWDYSLFQGHGGWSDKGCRVHAGNTSAVTRCVCQHLTAFSILMSQHAIPENPILNLLSQVGVGVSILALLTCLVIYRLVWGVVVRNKVSFFRHAALYNMVICLLVADACFLGGPFFPSGYHSLFCLATAFLCHFFYLATFFWMLAQALVLAHQLLFVFHQLSKYLVLSLMVTLGYLCPLGFAGVTLGLYLPQRKYLWEGKCLLNEDGVMLHAFSEPVLAIVCVNGLVLVIVVLKLLRPSLSEGPPVEKRQALVGVLKALLILTPIFGLTWGLGVAVIFDQDSMVSHYIFTILNSLQGVFILVFGCLTDKKVLEALRKRFRFRGTQSSNSAVSLATNESCTSEHSKERSERAR
ncbi:adhesion G-protein coupled receptor F3 isoform X2 [Mesocricetus auratus]|uniref:Adhesion G-protein coupled receptor F3 isoform X2 n=1 Tax=Mesocricetus auratus TaxID=10036 RepID=A0A3Q0CW38_MESAU|nr:adhesion G-protein coupled receptor F3 isoform X2 [Mesocricetus auratus]